MLRTIDAFDSFGYIVPVAVETGKTYRVMFRLVNNFPAGASAGMSVLEFDECLWIGQQYTKETFAQHFRGEHEERRLTVRRHGIRAFAFSTGAKTRMVDLVMFREGFHDGNNLIFDGIAIRQIRKERCGPFGQGGPCRSTQKTEFFHPVTERIDAQTEFLRRL